MSERDEREVNPHRSETVNAQHRKLWQDPEYRARMKAVMQSPSYRARVSEGLRKRWQDPDYRAR